jgi:hypothetical protein
MAKYSRVGEIFEELRNLTTEVKKMDHYEIEAHLEILFSSERGVWAEDAKYPLEDWQYEVANNDTRQGYRDWLYNKYANEEV